MKKLLTVLLALLLCFSLTACKKDEKQVVKEEEPTVVEPAVEDTTEVVEEVVEEDTTEKVEEIVVKDNSNQSYYVNFLNKDGSVLQRTTYKYGETPSYNGSTPTYSDGSYYYSFTGWDKKTSPVYGTQIYTALYTITGAVASNTNNQSNKANYLTFTAVELVYNELLKENVATIMPMFVTGSYQYSMDNGVTWENGTNTTIIVLDDIDDKVMLKGTNCATSYESNYHFSMTGKIAASGDVTSLTNGVGGDVDLSDIYSYENVPSASNGCYRNMFSGCTSLTTAPNLPSTTLAGYCYIDMFAGCTSLTTAPALPATTLATDCYRNMFQNCTSLTTAPTLSATTLTKNCYYRMFKNCTGLTTAPALPATTLVENCYYQMFYGCSSLNVYDAGTSTISEQTKMFICPDTPANYASDMFTGCAGSTTTPVAGHNYYIYTNYLTFTVQEANSTVKPKFASGDWSYSVSKDNGNTWTDWKEVKSTDNSKYNKTIISLGKVGYKVRLKGTNCTTYNAGTGDTVSFVMTGKFEASGDVTSLTNGVGGDAGLTTGCYYNMFNGCTQLTKAPSLPSTSISEACYCCMFYGCTALATAPALPATTLANSCYQQMFESCTSLATAPALPATTLAGSCYFDMFNGCTSLATAPALPATTLAATCYYEMFKDCTSLTTVPALSATTLANSCYKRMFYGCTSLNVYDAATNTISGQTKIFTCPENPSTYASNMFDGCAGSTTTPVAGHNYYIYTNYLTFTAKQAGSTIKFSWDEGSDVMTSTDGINWSSYTKGSTITLINENDYVMFKGTNCKTNDTYHFSMTGKISASGDVTSLTNGVGGDTVLTASCYNSMFFECYSLTSAPNLPATTLANDCYHSMFESCTKLTTAPALPATTLTSNCYRAMFYNCFKLLISVGDPQKNTQGVVFTCPSTAGLTDPVKDMFISTGGTFKGTPTSGNTYYWYNTTD